MVRFLVASDRRALGLVLGFCLLIQLTSATWPSRSFETPNESTAIARTLVQDGVFASGEARAYQLPGEPLYLAAGMRLMPSALWPYLHVPVAVAFVAAVAIIGFLAGGWPVGLAAGLAASIDPFVLVHGPVWDDTFLAAAFEWWIVVGVAVAFARAKVSWPLAGGLAAAAGFAAVTRLQSQVVLGLFGLAVVLLPGFRRARTAGVALLLGVAVALGAWGARNAAVLDEVFLGSSHDGKTLFESNCATTRQNLTETGHVGGAIVACAPAVTVAAVALPELAENRAFARAAWGYIAAHPFDASATAAFKAAVSLTGVNPALAWFSPRNLAMAAGSVVLLMLGLYGLWTVRALTGGVLALFAGITASVTLLMLMAGPVGLRYRISLSGLLFVGAGVALTRLRASALAKRALDVIVSGAGLVASLPVWVAVAALVKLEDGGPIFYGQDRVGENGRIFRVLKFRSMVPNAEAEVGALQASAHDPRVTRVGRWLRATAADELPQLWNIFRGDMSFVGPRALRPGEIEVGGEGRLVQLEEVPGFADRCRVRPGLTGVAQIYAPRDITRRHKFQYDKLYIRKRSFWLDVRLILLSFWITFRGTWEVRGQKF
jgi:lipopolysaccharide/colanic/teichoic acid biosynthesis glycosyltransferase